MFLLGMLFLINGYHCYNLDIHNTAILKIDSTRYHGKPQDVQNSYFGYSLAEYKEDGKMWIIVGAPKATPSYSYSKDPRDEESGGLFACDVTNMTSFSQQITCTEVAADNLNNETIWPHTTRNRSHQFLGGALTTPPGGKGIIVVCGHREMLENHKYSKTRMSGGCRQLSNLTNQGSVLWPEWNIWNSALGVSVVYIKDGSGILIGVPRYNPSDGILGGAVELRRNSEGFQNVKNYSIDFVWRDNYAGYDVTSGTFQPSGPLLRVVGAPLWNTQGKVYVFSLSSTRFSRIKHEILPPDPQSGSYFGAKVCACDLDGDGKDELLVGAPLYKMTAMEEGRVYVFKFSSNQFALHNVISGTVARGRFGSMILCTDDLDQDGFKDVVIGAPLEPKGGAAYVYNGASTGLGDFPSQKLTPPSGHRIHSFGHSVATLTNITTNRKGSQLLRKIKGIAIGAYRSSKVVLYKTRRVIFLEPRSELPETVPVTSAILLQDGGFVFVSNFNISLIYKKAQIDQIYVRVSVVTDSSILRTNISRHEWSRDVTLRYNQKTNLEIPLYLMERRLSYPYGFKVKVRYTLLRNRSLGSMEPILHPSRASQEEKPAKLDLLCGDSQQCETDISVYGAKFHGPEGTSSFVYKDARAAALEFGVKNRDNVARGVEVTVTLPQDIRYQSANISGNFTKVSCIIDGMAVKCTFNHFTPAWTDTGIRLSLRLRDVAPVRDVTFHVNVTTLTSEAGRKENNDLALKVPFVIKTDIDVAGHFTPNDVAVPISGGGKNKEVNYDVTLVNQGPGALPNVTWVLCVIGTNGRSLLRNPGDGKHGRCRYVRLPEIKYNLSIQDVCPSSTKTKTDCWAYACSVGDLDKDSVHKDSVPLEVNTDIARTILTNSRDIEFNFTVLVYGTKNLENGSELMIYTKGQSRLRLVGWKDDGPNLLWVIVGSSLGGGLFMAVAAIVLYKCGFFKRQKKEEMKRLIRQSVIKRCDEDQTGHDETTDLPPKY